MKKRSYFLVVICMFLLIVGCRKIEVGYEDEPCIAFPEATNAVGYSFQFPDFLFGKPCYNPLNSNQFTYNRINPSTKTEDLYIYDKSVQSSRLLLANVWGGGHWSESGWILVDAAGQVLKINANGDSLTVIDHGYREHTSMWGPRGENYIFSRNAETKIATLIADKNGVVYDSISGSIGFQPLCWLEDNRIYGAVWDASRLDNAESNGIGYYDIQNKTRTEIFHIGASDGGSLGITMSGDKDAGLLYWANGEGVYKTVIANGKTTRLIESCSSRYHASITNSGDGKKLLTDEGVKTLVGKNAAFFEQHILEVDLDAGIWVELDLE